ncbi:ribosome-inactivating family protein [Streptomyces sp. AD2-2]|nr:ribosome-inactivating family protein [Streptomyces sp. AD2-2]
MASRLLQRVGTSLAVPALVVGAFALADPSHTHSTSSKASSTLNLSTKDTELSASTWYLAHWDVDASGEGYANTISHLRSIIDAHGGHRVNVQRGGRNLAVDVTPGADADHAYIDLTVTTAGATIHLIIRVSDMYVVGWHFYSPQAGNVYIPLSRDHPEDIPAAVLSPTQNGFTQYGDMNGHENYNDLARSANTSLEDLSLSHQNLRQAVFDLHQNPSQPQANYVRNKSVGILRLIMAISEGTRFRPIAADLGRQLNTGGQTRMARYIELIRNWRDISRVFTNPGGALNWVHTVGWGDIRDRAAAAAVLMVALAARPVTSNIKDEL